MYQTNKKPMDFMFYKKAKVEVKDGTHLRVDFLLVFTN